MPYISRGIIEQYHYTPTNTTIISDTANHTTTSITQVTIMEFVFRSQIYPTSNFRITFDLSASMTPASSYAYIYKNGTLLTSMSRIDLGTDNESYDTTCGFQVKDVITIKLRSNKAENTATLSNFYIKGTGCIIEQTT